MSPGILFILSVGSAQMQQPEGSAALVCTDPPPAITHCDTPGACPRVVLWGDPEAQSGLFHGFADPALLRDPVVQSRIWLTYSYPHARLLLQGNGSIVPVAAVETHLARSDNGGQTFVYDSDLWQSFDLDDPEGSGEHGLYNSETPSLATIHWGGGVVGWYGAHLGYFMRPTGQYTPKYATSYVIRISGATSLGGLARAPDAVLGLRSTASVYGADVLLDELAGVGVDDCAMLNEPSLFAVGTTLYLTAQCLAFAGGVEDFTRVTTRLYATTPQGLPHTWAWRHVGVLANHALAVELGAETLVQPFLTRAADGTILFAVALAHREPGAVVGTTGDGCVAIAVARLEPPELRRDCDQRLVLRAVATGSGLGSCAYDAASASGMLAHDKEIPDGPWAIRRTYLRP